MFNSESQWEEVTKPNWAGGRERTLGRIISLALDFAAKIKD